MGTDFLLVGEGPDLSRLARHLDGSGYAVACTTAMEVAAATRWIEPAAVMIMPDVPDWQQDHVKSVVAPRWPETRIVVLRTRRLAARTNGTVPSE